MLLLALFLASAPAVFAQHWDPPINQGNMSVLVDEALLDGESLVVDDEIGIFTPAGILAGAAIITDEGFPVGPAAWGDDQDEQGINGFREGEQLFFKVWDHQADEEWDADVEVTFGEGIYQRDVFIACNLSAHREDIPRIRVANNEHDFEAVRIGRSATWEFSILSVGNSPLSVESVLTDNEAFTTDFDGAMEIANGDSQVVTVTFTPDAAGDASADLTITSDGRDMSEVTIHLVGVGEDALPPDIALLINERRFGRVIVGQTRNMSVFVFNEGDQPLVVSNVSTDNDVFTTDFEGQFEVAAGDRHEVVVSFTPSEQIAYEAELTIASNDPDEDIVIIPLSGEGRAEGAAAAEVMASEHFYSAIVVGQAGMWRMVVTNTGGSDLMVNDVTSDNEAFMVEFGNDPIRLRPGDYLYVNTSFNPEEVFFYDGILTVTTDDEENPEIMIPIAGSGVAANGRNFHAHNTGGSHSVLITATSLEGNVIHEGSEIAMFTESGILAGAGALGRDGQAGIAAYGDDESTEIVDGFIEGEAFSFMIWDNNSGEQAWANPEFEMGPETYEDGGVTVLSLSANLGDPLPDISLNAMDHFYGQVAVGESEDWVMSVSNQGRGTLHVMGIEPDLNEFTTDFDGEFELELGESRDITVTFTPSEENVEYEGRVTIMSDDPMDSVLYVDLFGLGVDVAREPEIMLGAPNHFFGAIPLNVDATYSLRINNVGGGLMRLSNVVVEGSNAFTTNWPGNPRNINANEFFDVMVTYHPAQVGTHQANLIITSDDPNNGEVRFMVEGDGVNEASHFHHRITDGNHSLLIDEAILTMPGDREAPLAAGDEIALFTESGLCAGHTVIDEAGAVGIAAWGDDRGTPVRDGFVDGEAFTWLVWDGSTRQELEGVPTYSEGPEVFQAQARTVLSRLEAHSDVVEAQIAVDPMIFQFGPIRARNSASHVFHISNTGGVDLTISRITSNMNVYTHDFNNQAVVLGPDEVLDVNVTFTPTEDAPYEGILTVFSDDPDQAQFTFRPNGVGSVEQGRFDFMSVAQNHSLLVEPFEFGGVDAAVGDEIGVFTTAGLCAGAGIVEQPGTCGVAAWGDDPETRFVVEGFQNGEAMTLKVWDSSQRREYEGDDIVVEVEDNQELNWQNDAINFLSIRVEGVVVLASDPGEVQVSEGEDVDIHFTIANAPGNMRLSILNRDEIAQNAGDVEFTDNGNNTADFHWETNFNSFRNRPYVLSFQATNGDITDVTSVMITIVNVNQAPEVQPFQDDLITFDEDQAMAGAPPRLVVIPDMRNLFTDPDGNALTFITQAMNPNMTNEHRVVAGVPRWQIDLPANFFGDVRVTLRANDNQQGAPERDMRRVDGAAGAFEANISNPSETPVRDLITDYTFTMRFRSINDIPVITAPQNNGQFVWNIDERQDAALQFNGTDVESQGDQIVWTMPNRGGLPDEARFVDNRNGTATLSWQPTADDIGQYQTVVRMADADGGADEINNLTINVRGINDAPVYNDQNPLEDVVIQEDADRVVIATLNDNHWVDPDQGDQLNFGVVAPAPADLQVQYNAQTTEVSIQPRLNINGEFDITVYCRDRAQAPNEVREVIHVTVEPVNDAPTFVPPNIANIRIAEDSNLNELQIARLNLKFRDIDVGDVLAYAVDGPAEFGLRIDAGTTALFRTLSANYNTAALDGDSAIVTVTATDRAGESVSTQFGVTVTPDINDLPSDRAGGGGAFRLLTPEMNHNFEGPDSLGPFVFSWEPAIQNQWEIDSVRYWFRAWIPGRQDTLKFDTLSGTQYPVPNDSLFVKLGQRLRDRDITIHWKVIAVDRGMLVVAQQQRNVPAANNNFAFTASRLEIRELPHAEMPENYFISNSYPNPFNARTTLKFGLPTPGDVEVSVWDMHGRKIAQLAGGRHEAGQYELTWTAEGQTSGIYLIKMQSGAFIGMQKAILVR